MNFAKVFKRADLLPIAVALAEHSHGDQTIFELTAGITTDGNRQQRASALLEHLFMARVNPDESILELLDFMYFSSGSAEKLRESPKFKRLEGKVLQPRGVILDDDGFRFGGTPVLPQAKPFTAEELMFTSPPAQAAPVTDRVFVVHGRDTAPLHQLEKFLSFLNLGVMSWAQARTLTQNPQPTTYEIVSAGIRAAAAVIIIFSPDDMARLSHHLTPVGETHETPSGQPRQNVILEAGMALATAPQRTIIVRSGHIREISDISGFNYVTMDGSWGSREDLLNRLRDAGAAVQQREPDLKHRLAGDFMVPKIADQ